MRLLLVAAGLILSGAPHTFAISVPPAPPALSPYVQDVFSYVRDDILAPATAPVRSCTPSEAGAVMDFLRSLFFSADRAAVLPQRDLERTVCHRSDIEALEWYLGEIIGRMLEDCSTAQEAYRRAAGELWDAIRAVRGFGLDPRTEVPVPGGEDCPYFSGYAARGFGNVGCTAPPALTPFQRLEVEIIESIMNRIGTLGAALPLFHETLSAIREGADQFVVAVHVVRLPIPFARFTPVFTPRTVPNAGEFGCLDSPSGVTSGPVTGEDIPLEEHFPSDLVLTKELRDVLSYLLEREDGRWFEYPLFPELNRAHLDRESAAILSIRDPQHRMEGIANFLHARTREFAAQAVPLPGSPFDPPLRSLVRRFGSFLSRLCVSRKGQPSGEIGCHGVLLRTIELSLRDECFSSFLMDTVFRANPAAGTLPPCSALIVGP